ncbi:hypothetical protein CU041_02145 [Thalassospira povalilytica]|uniref:Uncharacterized protein n=1 Tax=Thalassospira povalilytica TaxID=732237 RepID=A0ABX4RCV9_9PROT|nr:hypothetical protein CU041_02145 [Thalassospira povalilytica]
MGCALSGGSVRAVACEGGEVGGADLVIRSGRGDRRGMGRQTVWWRRLTLPGGGGGVGDHVDEVLGPGPETEAVLVMKGRFQIRMRQARTGEYAGRGCR